MSKKKSHSQEGTYPEITERLKVRYDFIVNLVGRLVPLLMLLTAVIFDQVVVGLASSVISQLMLSVLNFRR